MKKYQNGGKKRLTLSKASLTKIKNAQNNVAPKSNIVGELMTGPAKAAGAIIVQGSTGKMLISAAKKLLSKAPKGKLEREIAGRTTNVIARDMAKNTELQQVAKKTAALAKKSYAKKLAKNPDMKFEKGGKKLHLGFKETQAKIAKKQGISKKAAGAILASSARKASPAAVKKNPALKNVPGVKKYINGGATIRIMRIAADQKKRRGNKTKAYSAKSTEEKLGNDTYRMNKAFRATKSGKLISEATQDYPTRGRAVLFDKTTTVMDTTGYSKGKKSFPAKRTKYDPFNTDLLTGEQLGVKTETFDVPRNKVKKTIKEMKSNTGMLQKEKAAKLKKKVVKKYADGGKTNKGIYKGVEYNSKGDIISKYDVSSKKGDRNQYSVYADGKPVKHTYNPTTNTSRRAELDTLGYSKGKQSFTKTVELKKGNGKIVKTKTKVPRKSVLTQIKSMQTMKNGGKKR